MSRNDTDADAGSTEKMASSNTDAAGWTDEQIDSVLKLEIPDNEYFSRRGVYGNYHGGGNILFEDESILNWIILHRK